MLPDSEIGKKMALHRTKAGYLVNYGIGEFHNTEVMDRMKLPYSINYDGSTVGKKEQLNINVSYRAKNNRIERSNLTTIEVTSDSKLSSNVLSLHQYYTIIITYYIQLL